jgi:apolipoprotein N-acyltransferase
LSSNTKTWLISGFFIGIFWFWWIALSFKHYHMIWAIPIVVIAMGLLYAVIFWSIAWISEKIMEHFTLSPSGNALGMHASLFTLTLKALGLLVLSYIHPFGFDWFKPELMFVNSYIGIEKWQFAFALLAIILTIWRNNVLFLFLILLAYQPTSKVNIPLPEEIDIVTMHTSVEDKWNKTLHPNQFKDVLQTIDHAIEQKKRLIILPESVFPIFLNYKLDLLAKLETRAKHISIVAGGLHWDGKTPHNSTYIFTNGKITIANKVLLVPFGESNPLPDFLSDWVNKVFYDGAVDYKASENVVDYSIDGVIYRNAICFEATSERLYAKDLNNLRPKNMIVLSNNGWFTPSIEPVLQRLLLQYYSKKYGTTIYHSVNMSTSYIIQDGMIAKQ